MQSLGIASTEQAKVFLSTRLHTCSGWQLRRRTPAGRHPSGQPGHFLPQTSAYKAVSFRAWCHLPSGAERALSDCASRHVGFPGAPLLETMAGVATEGPACHLASWQAAEPRWKLNPIGMLQVLRAPGQGLKHRPGDSRATRSFSLGRGIPWGFLGLRGWVLGHQKEPPREGGLQKPPPICESRAGRGQGQARGAATTPHPSPHREHCTEDRLPGRKGVLPNKWQSPTARNKSEEW